MGATVRNGGSYMKRVKVNEERERMARNVMEKMPVERLSELLSFYNTMGQICSQVMEEKLHGNNVNDLCWIYMVDAEYIYIQPYTWFICCLLTFVIKFGVWCVSVWYISPLWDSHEFRVLVSLACWFLYFNFYFLFIRPACI